MALPTGGITQEILNTRNAKLPAEPQGEWIEAIESKGNDPDLGGNFGTGAYMDLYVCIMNRWTV